jgi:hypothetical protein
VSPYYYLWVKYALLAYLYDPAVALPELSSISLYLYTPRHQGAPQHALPLPAPAPLRRCLLPQALARVLHAYMAVRFITEDAKNNPCRSRGRRGRTAGRCHGRSSSST